MEGRQGYKLVREAAWEDGGGDTLIRFKFSTNAVGKGKYNVKTFSQTPVKTITASSDISEADLGTLSTAEDGLVLNAVELGLSGVTGYTGHMLTETINTQNFGPYGWGILRGKNADGKKVIDFCGWWVACKPPTSGDGTYAPPASITVSNGFVVAAS